LFALGAEEGFALAERMGLAVVFAQRTPDGSRTRLTANAEAMAE
jgi:hypothetical protein